MSTATQILTVLAPGVVTAGMIAWQQLRHPERFTRAAADRKFAAAQLERELES